MFPVVVTINRGYFPKRRQPVGLCNGNVMCLQGIERTTISGSNAGYTMFRSSVKSTGYPLHSPVSPSLSLPFVTMCHHISTGLYVGLEKCCLSLKQKPTNCSHLVGRSRAVSVTKAICCATIFVCSGGLWPAPRTGAQFCLELRLRKRVTSHLPFLTSSRAS